MNTYITSLFIAVAGLFLAFPAFADKQVSVYAAPLAFGTKVQIQSTFGSNVWCKFSEIENHAGGPVVYQYWSSDTNKWSATVPEQILHGQSVWLSAKSAGTGGALTISVEGSGIK